MIKNANNVDWNNFASMPITNKNLVMFEVSNFNTYINSSYNLPDAPTS